MQSKTGSAQRVSDKVRKAGKANHQITGKEMWLGIRFWGKKKNQNKQTIKTKQPRHDFLSFYIFVLGTPLTILFVSLVVS